MVLLLFVVCLLLTILFGSLTLRGNDAWIIATILCGLVAIGFLVGLVFIAYDVNTEYAIDEKIELYQTENAEIEKQINEMVQNYMNYEQETFDKTKGNTNGDVMTLISMFPELKSDTLVATQIENYTNNKQKVISLKEQKINVKKEKWLFYFGH